MLSGAFDKRSISIEKYKRNVWIAFNQPEKLAKSLYLTHCKKLQNHKNISETHT